MFPGSYIKIHAGKSRMYTFNFSKLIKDAVLHQQLSAFETLLNTTVILSVGLPEQDITKS